MTVHVAVQALALAAIILGAILLAQKRLADLAGWGLVVVGIAVFLLA